MTTLSKSAFRISSMRIKKTKAEEKFDIDKFLDSPAGQRYIERGLKSKVLSKKEADKRFRLIHKKFGLI